MSTVTTEIQRLQAAKTALKASIEAKGVTVGNATIDTYAAKVDLIDEWVAPSDWIQLEEPNDNEILLLASDINPYYAFVVNVTGGYTVNWGDGTVDNWASGATASHTYTVGAGQSCSRGYTTFKIRIYAQNVVNNIVAFSAQYIGVWQNITSILWARFGTRFLRGAGELFGRNAGGGNQYQYLECIQFPTEMPNCKTWNVTANACTSLKKVDMPKNLNGKVVGDFFYAFQVNNLTKIDFSGFKDVSRFQNVISSTIERLTIIPFQNFKNATNCQYAFSKIKADVFYLPNNDGLIPCDVMFESSHIRKIVFNDTYEGKITKINGIFNLCTSEEIIFINQLNLSSGDCTNFSANNSRIRRFTFPNQNIGVPITTLTSAFSNCINLSAIYNFPALNSVTAYNNMFNGCLRLEFIENLDQLGDTTTGMDHSTTFSQCSKLNPVGGLRIRNKITGRFNIGNINGFRYALQALLFTNPSAVSTWAGASPQIDVSYCSMDATALNALFTSIIATSASFSGKTIRITGNPGAATCDTTIITNAGGTVNKTT